MVLVWVLFAFVELFLCLPLLSGAFLGTAPAAVELGKEALPTLSR